MTLNELADRLVSRAERYRTGIALTPSVAKGHLEDLAVALDLQIVDLASEVLGQVPEDSRFLGLNAARLSDVIKFVSAREYWRPAVLLANSDILLTYLSHTQRAELLRFFDTGMPKPVTAMIMALPADNPSILSAAEALRWRASGRLAEQVTRPSTTC